MAVERLVGAMDPVPVELAGLQFRDKSMPYLVRPFRELNPMLFLAGIQIKQTKLNSGRIRGKKREIDPGLGPRGAQRVGVASTKGFSQIVLLGHDRFCFEKQLDI